MFFSMKNVDCEIYVSQLVSFFEKNPNDLMILIGDLQKEEFYKKLKEQCYKNLESNDDPVISKQQMVDIIIDLKIPELNENQNPKSLVEAVIQKTKWGDMNLN